MPQITFRQACRNCFRPDLKWLFHIVCTGTPKAPVMVAFAKYVKAYHPHIVDDFARP